MSTTTEPTTYHWRDVILEDPDAPTLADYLMRRIMRSGHWPRTKDRYVALCDAMRDAINAELRLVDPSGQTWLRGDHELIVSPEADTQEARSAVVDALSDHLADLMRTHLASTNTVYTAMLVAAPLPADESPEGQEWERWTVAVVAGPDPRDGLPGHVVEERSAIERPAEWLRNLPAAESEMAEGDPEMYKKSIAHLHNTARSTLWEDGWALGGHWHEIDEGYRIRAVKAD